MSVKRAARHQHRAIVDGAAKRAASLHAPPEGWLRTARKALGMSGTQLARRMGVSRARVSQVEQAELRGTVTLQSMQAAAEAMGCRFVYAVVPPGAVEDLVAVQARRKAQAVVATASRHMALEDQALPEEAITREVATLAADLARTMPADFWDGP